MGGAGKHVGIGDVAVWPGGSLWIGVATGPTADHAHHAVQLSFSAAADYEMREGRGPWRPFRASLIPNDITHAFRAFDVQMAHVFVEPESTVGRHILERHAGPGVTALPPDAAAEPTRLLTDAWRHNREPAALVAAAQAALRALSGDPAPEGTPDPRVLGAIEIIKARLEAPLALTEVARAIHISPSRLRHLFVQETGLPFRRYVLWQRLQVVFRLMRTESMTEAAHAAGFADAAHMTRTFRRMMGIAPTALARD